MQSSLLTIHLPDPTKNPLNIPLNKPLQILELFGGIGSPRCALRNLGYPIKPLDYVEITLNRVKTYQSIFENEPVYIPQNIINYTLLADVLIHGSPCQDNSIAGHYKDENGKRVNKGKGFAKEAQSRSSLVWETLRIIESMGVWKPRIVIWENVKGTINKNGKETYNQYIAEMSRLGYTSSHAVLNARDFGLPQNRERIFTVSILGNYKFDFSTLRKRPMRPLSDFLEKDEDIPEMYNVTQPSILGCIGAKGIRRATVITDCAYTVTCRQDRTPAQVILRPKKHPDDPDVYRFLTEKEVFLLQGFTVQDFQAALRANPSKPGKMNYVLYEQAGNAMPVQVMEALFEQLLPSPWTFTNDSLNLNLQSASRQPSHQQMSLFAA